MNTKTGSFLTFRLTLPSPPSSAQSPNLNASVTWVGNSSNGKTACKLQDVHEVCVLPDGMLLTNVGGDKGGAKSTSIVFQWLPHG